MANISVMVVDPGGVRTNQLLNNEQVLHELVPILVSRLSLPRQLNYQLIPTATMLPMEATDTLAGIGASPGAEFKLKLVRDNIFAGVVDRLYEEAEKYVVEKLWSLAKEKLETVLRLKPEHEDPKGLRQKIEIQLNITIKTPALATAGSGVTVKSVIVVISIIVSASFVFDSHRKSQANKALNTNSAIESAAPTGEYYLIHTKQCFINGKWDSEFIPAYVNLIARKRRVDASGNWELNYAGRRYRCEVDDVKGPYSRQELAAKMKIDPWLQYLPRAE